MATSKTKIYRWGPYKGSPGHRTWGVWARTQGTDVEDLVVVCVFKRGALEVCRRLNAYERTLTKTDVK